MNVEALWIHPVKACAGVSVASAVVGPRGFQGDRRWMFVDEEGRHVTQREYGSLATVSCHSSGSTLLFDDGPAVEVADAHRPVTVTIWGDEVVARLAPEAASAWISARVGAPLRLVYMAEDSVRPANPRYATPGDEVSFADGYPYLLVNTRSLAQLNGRLARDIPMRRFRPNIVVSGEVPWEEDRWRRVRIGSVEFDVVKPCARCVVIDTDPETGVRRKGVLSELARFRRTDGNVYFGQNAIARGKGTIEVGMHVEVLEQGEPRPPLS